MIEPQFLRFLLAGGVAAGANFGSRFVFSDFFTYSVAVFLAYMVGMLVAFLMMRRHVFNATQGSLASHISKFIGVNLIAVLQTLAISLLLARWLLPSVGILDYAEALGHLISVLVPVFTSYFGHKNVTFK